VTVYGELVGRHGLAESHRLLLAAVPDGARVLDVGCAEGYLAAALKQRGCEVVGVEASAEAAERARPHLEELVVGDVEDAAVRERVTGSFDVVLFGDVLEHLRDAETVLRWAAAIAPRVVVSLPNIAHWTARRQLLRGRFPREDHGLFDRTHLRFFTRATARELVESCGLRVEHEAFAPAPLPLQSRIPQLAKLQPLLVSRRPELFALQIVLTCAPTAAR
jgi:methionine biosynthesis protein MetW